MGVLYNGLVEHPNSHFEGTLPTNGFIENKLLFNTWSGAYNPTTATNSCLTGPLINLSSYHISGQEDFRGNTYRMVFDFTWSGYTSGNAWYQGSVNGSWSSGTNWFVSSANGVKTMQSCINGGTSGTYHYDFLITIPSTASVEGQNRFYFGIRSDSANEGTYYKIHNLRVYSYNGGIDKDKMSFNHFYEW
jgi:hypothetical protein